MGSRCGGHGALTGCRKGCDLAPGIGTLAVPEEVGATGGSGEEGAPVLSIGHSGCAGNVEGSGRTGRPAGSQVAGDQGQGGKSGAPQAPRLAGP